MQLHRWWWLVALVLRSSVAFGASCAPPVMLWAWERPEHLETIDPRTTGVAFLARTIRLAADGSFEVRPRLQPLAVPPGTYLVAVVRIESSPRRGAARVPRKGRASPAAEARTLTAAIAAALRPGVGGLQVDYDAPRSERGRYREVLRALRLALPPSIELSMTALASWALGDSWLDDLPVDDVVPMLFRMGADDRVVRRRLAEGGDFTSPRARRSLGVALDEARPVVPPGRRIYVFNARAWSPARVAEALAEVRRWNGAGLLGSDLCASSS